MQVFAILEGNDKVQVLMFQYVSVAALLNHQITVMYVITILGSHFKKIGWAEIAPGCNLQPNISTGIPPSSTLSSYHQGEANELAIKAFFSTAEGKKDPILKITGWMMIDVVTMWRQICT